MGCFTFWLPEDLNNLGSMILEVGQRVDTGHWQALKDVPQTKTIELQNVVVNYPIPPPGGRSLVEELEPNLPWADMHFAERVSGIPYNPPPSAAHWPFRQRGHKDHVDENKQFSHTYPERFWPKSAVGRPWHCDQPLNHGIRYDYGDLMDVMALLNREPYTRQAVLPVWFPEDTGAFEGQRVPCTLYYHFLFREGHLDINYTIRSCDFLRHFRDDLYMAALLCKWMVAEVPHFERWGTVTMMMHSLHVFEGDLPIMRKRYGGG